MAYDFRALREKARRHLKDEEKDPVPKAAEHLFEARAALRNNYTAVVHIALQPDDLQLQVIHDMHPRKLCVWGRRRGKTTTALLWLAERSLNKPHTENWYVAPTYKQAKRIAWEAAKRLLPKALLARRPNEAELTFYFKNGSRLRLVGAEDPDSLRGQGLWSVVMDEYGTMRQDAWNLAIEPQLTDTNGHALFIGTPNALKGPHLQKLWLKVMSGALEPDWLAIPKEGSPTADAKHVNPATIERARKELRGWQFRQEYEASFETISGRVWPEFDQRLYADGGSVVQVPAGERYMPCPRDWQVVAGVDFGWVHPTAVVWLALGPSNQMLVLGEHVAQSMRIEDHVREMRRIAFRWGGLENMMIYCDPSRPDLIHELQAVHGLGAVKANNSVELGVNRVGQFLGHKNLLISAGCVDTISSVMDYSYDPKASVPKILKENDNECDALRYAVMGAAPPRDEDADKYSKGEWEEDETFMANWFNNVEEQWRKR